MKMNISCIYTYVNLTLYEENPIAKSTEHTKIKLFKIPFNIF